MPDATTRWTLLVAALAALACTPVGAQQGDRERWPLLSNPFESTSGGGVMIDGYDPVVGERDGRPVCTTDYTVRVPGATPAAGTVVFDARPVQGGILCTNGRFRMRDSDASGTTPLEVFIKDGVRRRSP